MSEIRALYSDGGLLSFNPSDVGGMWSWVGVDREDNRPLLKGQLPGGVNVDAELVVHETGIIHATTKRFITNNVVEMVAAIKALEYVPEGWSGPMYLDSEITLGRLFHGYALRGLPPNVIDRLHKVIARVGQVKGILLQGHPTKKDLLEGFGKKRGLPVSKWNVFVDNQCNVAAEEFRTRMRQI